MKYFVRGIPRRLMYFVDRQALLSIYLTIRHKAELPIREQSTVRSQTKRLSCLIVLVQTIASNYLQETQSKNTQVKFNLISFSSGNDAPGQAIKIRNIFELSSFKFQHIVLKDHQITYERKLQTRNIIDKKYHSVYRNHTVISQ